MCVLAYRFLAVAVDSSKRSPELIQLLDMHIHFSAGTPGTRVCHTAKLHVCVSVMPLTNTFV